jgi:pimeloyl-ACP methyl ester carboxylesterase
MNGYLLLHGKNSGPNLSICSMNPVADRMKQQGLLYDHTTHSWGLGRVFQEPFERCLDDVAAGIQRLRNQGATRIHLVGHSLGGNVAFFFATRFSDFKSIVALAPAHNTHISRFNMWSQWSRNKAQSLLDAGNDAPADFIDVAMLETYIIQCVPSAYLSYLDPQGNTVMTKNVRRFQEPVHLFIGSGSNDMTQVNVKELLFDPARKTSASQLVETGDDHLTVAINTYEKWVRWCEDLPD